MFTDRERDKRYSSFIANYTEHYSQWVLAPLLQIFSEQFDETPAQTKKRLGKEPYEKAIDQFVLDNAEKVVQPVRPDYDSVGQETRDLIDISKTQPDKVFLQERVGHPDIYIKDGQRWLFYKGKLKEIDGRLVAGEPLTNLWDDLLSNNLHNEGGVKFPKGKKPEALIKRIFELFSEAGDLVLDSFLGSGTTAAVAHKMKRQYIGVEMGQHAETHCRVRLKTVIDGDSGGISRAVNWMEAVAFDTFALELLPLMKRVKYAPTSHFPYWLPMFGSVKPGRLGTGRLTRHVWGA